MMLRFSFGFMCLLAVLPAGCGGSDSKGDDGCPSIARPYLSVSVVDDTGTRICDAQVTVEVSGQTLSPGAEGTPCKYQTFEGELEAEHRITVTADGHQPYTASVRVSTDECGGPKTQELQLQLTRGPGR